MPDETLHAAWSMQLCFNMLNQKSHIPTEKRFSFRKTSFYKVLRHYAPMPQA